MDDIIQKRSKMSLKSLLALANKEAHEDGASTEVTLNYLLHAITDCKEIKIAFPVLKTLLMWC